MFPLEKVIEKVTSEYQLNGGVIAGGQNFPLTTVGPYQCWRGDVAADPNFWDPKSAALQACCGSPGAWVRPGASLDLGPGRRLGLDLGHGRGLGWSRHRRAATTRGDAAANSNSKN